jgi:CubicO group peptidase (beta-lactamase class C family)
MKRFVLYLFFLSCFGNALAQELDAFIIEEIEANRIAGAEVYIHHNGEAVWHKALGKSNSKRQTALKKNSLYYIQSMTKPIISTAIMQLVEKGKINLNDAI